MDKCSAGNRRVAQTTPAALWVGKRGGALRQRRRTMSRRVGAAGVLQKYDMANPL